MKAEERKALEQNALVEGLEKAYEGVRKGPSSTALYWIGGIAAVVLVVYLFWWFRSSADMIASARWTALDDVAFPAQLDDLLAKSDLKDTPQGRLARFKEARLKLAEGIRNLGGLDKKRAREKITDATLQYETLLKSSSRVPLLQQEALWMAAKGREALGEYDAARAHYTRLKDEFKKTALGEDAAKQLARLDDPANQAALAELKREFDAGPTGPSN